MTYESIIFIYMSEKAISINIRHSVLSSMTSVSEIYKSCRFCLASEFRKHETGSYDEGKKGTGWTISSVEELLLTRN